MLRISVAPSSCDLVRQFQASPFDDLRNRVFVGMLGQNDIRNGYAGMKKVGQKVDGPCVSGFMFEQNQSVGPFLEHCFGFLEGVGVFQFSRKHAVHAVQNFANQEKVFLFLAYQQDAHGVKRGFCGY